MPTILTFQWNQQDPIIQVLEALGYKRNQAYKYLSMMIHFVEDGKHLAEIDVYKDDEGNLGYWHYIS